jgi:urease accessory protein
MLHGEMAPGDMPSRRMQRAEGTGRFSVKKTGNRSALEILHESGAAKLRFPRQIGGAGALEAIVINTAGGMTGGDRFNWEIVAGRDTNVSVTTQANEKVYKASADAAEVDISLQLEGASRLAWLPQETILFQHAALARKVVVDMAPGSELLLCEAIVFGRHGHGEKFTQGLLRDRWRVRAGDTLVHAEELYLEGDAGHALGRAAVAGGAGAVATVLAIGGESRFKLGAAREIIASCKEVSGGVSVIRIGETPGIDDSGTGKLLARLVAKDGYLLRKALVPLIGLLNGEAGLPKSWSL